MSGRSSHPNRLSGVLFACVGFTAASPAGVMISGAGSQSKFAFVVSRALPPFIHCLSGLPPRIPASSQTYAARI